MLKYKHCTVYMIDGHIIMVEHKSNRLHDLKPYGRIWWYEYGIVKTSCPK